MKLDNKTLINKIKNEKTWISAKELAEFFGVSSRTIRNRINEINHYTTLIQSSYRGYLYNSTANCEIENKSNKNNNELVEFILRKLIQDKELINIYDLADSMYISDSQFERTLNQVKEYITLFNLELFRRRNMIQLQGNELDKRRLINNLIRKENANGFLSSDTIESFISHNDLELIKNSIQSIFEEHKINVNDYGYYTILLHIIIIHYRASQRNYDDNTHAPAFNENDQAYKVASEIIEIINKQHNITLPSQELYNLTIIINNNCTNAIQRDNYALDPESCIGSKYINLTKAILNKLVENYYLTPFSDEFIINLSIHIKNLISRSENNTYTMNPLASKFKEQYPLIYDMASFIMKEVNKFTHINIIDDEIAFIAFHIGSYIENSRINQNKVNCCILYADYNNMFVKAEERILSQLGAVLYISKTLSIRYSHHIPENTELVISLCGKIPDIDKQIVYTNILLSDEDINLIREKVEEINHKKKARAIKESLRFFINDELFKKDFYTKDHIEMIQALARDCADKGLVDKSFADEVIDREMLSSTSFSNGIAIPHSLNASAYKSFLYIVLNSKGMRWGNHLINIIVLIGTSNNDRQAFKNVFDGIIELLYEPENIRTLLKCSDYNDFITALIHLL